MNGRSSTGPRLQGQNKGQKLAQDQALCIMVVSDDAFRAGTNVKERLFRAA
jgi:hypothetical protein